jgi:hypothetical protein
MAQFGRISFILPVQAFEWKLPLVVSYRGLGVMKEIQASDVQLGFTSKNTFSRRMGQEMNL